MRVKGLSVPQLVVVVWWLLRVGYLRSTVSELLSAVSSGGIVSEVSGSSIVGSAGSTLGSTAGSVASELGGVSELSGKNCSL